MRFILNPLTGLFDVVGSGSSGSSFITSVADTATIDLDVTLGTLTANLLSLTGFDTDDLAEGASNLYFTQSRARLSLSSVTPTLGYNNSNGEFSLGIVPISLGGSGQSNQQAAINNLTDQPSHSDGDVFQLLGGNAQFAPYVAPGTTGTPNTLAFYNSVGDLGSDNYWQAFDDGRLSGSFNYTGDNQALLNLTPNITITDTWNSVSIISGTLNNNGVLTGFNSLLNLNFNLSGAISTEFINGINIGTQGDVTQNKQFASFYSSGVVGGNLSGLYIDSADDVTGNTNLFSINAQGTYTGQLTLANWGNQNAVGDQIRFLDWNNSGTVANNLSGLFLNSQGAVTRGLDFLALNVSGNVGDGSGVSLNGFNMNIQNTAVINGNIQGFNLNNAASFSGTNNNLNGATVFNSGAGYRYAGYSSYNNANLTEEIRGFTHSTQGDSRTSTGLDIYLQGNATDDAQGIRVSVNNQTSTNARVRSLDAQGATYSFSNVYAPQSGLFVDTGNNNFTEFRVASGSPVTGTDTLVNNNIVAFLVEDDVALGPVSLGQVHTSAISLLGVATGKTIDLLRGLLVVASVQDPGYANVGTVSSYQGIVYAGALPGGGSTVVTEAIGLYMPSTFDSYAGTNWGIRVEGTTAENYVNRLAVGTAGFVVGNALYGVDVDLAVHANDYYSADGTIGDTATPSGLEFKNGLYVGGAVSGIDVDGGTAASVYGGIDPVDGGGA